MVKYVSEGALVAIGMFKLRLLQLEDVSLQPARTRG